MTLHQAAWSKRPEADPDYIEYCQDRAYRGVKKSAPATDYSLTWAAGWFIITLALIALYIFR